MEPLLQFFTYEHLPERLQDISKPFASVARQLAAMPPEVLAVEADLVRRSQATSLLSVLCRSIDVSMPANPEATWAVVKIGEAKQLLADGRPLDEVLRRLLEAKDCAVRALLFRHPTYQGPGS